jgi:hypothetical protein
VDSEIGGEEELYRSEKDESREIEQGVFILALGRGL